jgi:putative transposase
MTLRRAAISIERSRGQAPTRPARERHRKASVVPARLDNLIERGTDPMLCCLFIVDGSKAVIKAIRRTFGRRAPISGAQTGTCAEVDLQRLVREHLQLVLTD